MCGIYEVRPQQCRTWPFWPELLRDKASWDRASERCPGMNKGTFFPVEQIRIIRDGTPKR
jgi:Fe-S-cluster containining protein